PARAVAGVGQGPAGARPTAAPWRRLVPVSFAGLAPEQEAFVGLALALRAAPAEVRSAPFLAAVRAWRADVAEQQPQFESAVARSGRGAARRAGRARGRRQAGTRLPSAAPSNPAAFLARAIRGGGRRPRARVGAAPPDDGNDRARPLARRSRRLRSRSPGARARRFRGLCRPPDAPPAGAGPRVADA